MKKHVTFILFLLVVFSCNKNRLYTNSEFGIELNIPAGWEIQDTSDFHENAKKGLEVLKEKNANTVKVTGMEKILLALKKDRLNKFRLVLIPYKEKYRGEWIENYQNTKKQIFNSFASLNFKVDSSSTREKIDGIDFEVFKIFVQMGIVEMNQEMYRTCRNDFEYIFTLNYNNPGNRQELSGMLKNAVIRK